jgi:lipid-A-disaccharide synthase
MPVRPRPILTLANLPRQPQTCCLSQRFLISAGEASGDAHGAQLVSALRTLAPDAEFFGVGGAALRAAGCATVVDARDVAVVGLAEVVTHLPKIYREFHKLLAAVDRSRPDAAILIDFPDFNFRLARQLHRRNIPVFYYISPQLWAWRAGRVELVRRYVRKMLVIFPFEEQFYRERGVDAIYVGHPLAEIERPTGDRRDFAARHDLDADRPWIVLLPGSRRREVAMNLPAMVAAAARLGRDYQFILPVANTLNRDEVGNWLARITSHLPQAGKNATPGLPAAEIRTTDCAREALAHARAGIVGSGTATLEAALLGTPFVMVYRVSPLSWTVGRRLVKVPHFGIVNLVLGRRAVPELVQKAFTPERVQAEITPLLENAPARQAQLEAFTQLRQLLRLPEGVPAAARAAQVILNAL